MKKLLLMTSVMATSFGFSQMIEDFEGATLPNLPAGWSQVTAATDGGYKTTSDITSTYFIVPAHTKYAGTNDDDCNCDKANEALISPVVAVPATGADLITFDYALGQYYGETANFGYTTDGGTTVTDLGLLANTQTGGSDHGWVTASFPTTAVAGSSVQFVWTYHDNADWGSGLAIDDVQMISLPSVDMEMTALTMVPTIVAGNASITGTVTNVGGDNITSIDITWNDGSGLNSETFAVNLNFGDTYNFTHGTLLYAAPGQTYNLDVCVVATGDAVAANDCLAGSISAVSSIVQKVTVGEEKTGEWCGWCPRGAVALAEMSLSNPTDFIGIAVHNGDAMAFAAYDGAIGTYVPGGYPGGGVDRVLDGDPSDFSTMHASRVSMVPPAAVGVTMVDNGSTVDVTVSAYFVGGLTGDYRLAAVILEDNVAGNGQTNYYDDGGAGALAYPNTGSMPNFNFVGGGATVSPVSHDHVARALGDNEINGVAGSLPGTVSDGDLLSHTYTITKGAWDMNNVHPVGMLVNGATGEILNAGNTALAADVSVEEVALNSFNVTTMPNPTSGVSNIVVDLAVAADMNIVVVDMLGNEVYNSGTVSLDAGSYATQVNLTNNAAGVYFAKVNLNGAVKTVKINVVK